MKILRHRIIHMNKRNSHKSDEQKYFKSRTYSLRNIQNLDNENVVDGFQTEDLTWKELIQTANNSSTTIQARYRQKNWNAMISGKYEC